MNSDSQSNRNDQLDIHGDATPNVPVFSCVVYLQLLDQGRVRARVMNLEGLECTADSERAALAQLVPAFKERIAELLQRGQPIPWIDPPPAPAPDQRQRLIPVHL